MWSAVCFKLIWDLIQRALRPFRSFQKTWELSPFSTMWFQALAKEPVRVFPWDSLGLNQRPSFLLLSSWSNKLFLFLSSGYHCHWCLVCTFKDHIFSHLQICPWWLTTHVHSPVTVSATVRCTGSWCELTWYFTYLLKVQFIWRD